MKFIRRSFIDVYYKRNNILQKKLSFQNVPQYLLRTTEDNMRVLLGFQTVRPSAILGCDFMHYVYSVNLESFRRNKNKIQTELTSNSHAIFCPTLISDLLKKQHVCSKTIIR